MITGGMDEFRKSLLLFVLICSLIINAVSAANDTMYSSQMIRDGETLVSSGGKFELGFFSPGNSTNRYVGIWYKNITDRTYVWVANRQAPLTSKSGVLRVLAQPGILALFNHTNGSVVWSSNASRAVGNPSAQLLETGNLVLKDADDDRPENFLWQSFDYPSDSFLPGMSLGWDFRKGVETYLSSWRSSDDPAPGEFTIHFDPAGLPQILLKRNEAVQYRIGPWNGLRFSGSPTIVFRSPIYLAPIHRSIVMNENEVRYKEDTEDQSLVTRALVNLNGGGQRWRWDSQARAWGIYSFLGENECDIYNLCGANAVCTIGNSQLCDCLARFVLKDQERSNGCIRKAPLSCQGDVFLKYSGMKLPDARNSTWDGRRMPLAECEVECSNNCSCTAYTQLDIRQEGSGCLFYHGELIDIRTVSRDGQDLYIRMASTEQGKDSKGKKQVILIPSLTSVAGVVLVCLCLTLFCRWRRKNDPSRREEGLAIGSHPKEQVELPFFPLSTILKATDHFNNKNKLGEGGFGPVYKGLLEDGQEIAVKCLSKTSLQGVEELKNEVILIAKLQHRNLVRTLGCCIEEEEKMLVYEYMPNNSLDLILFDKTNSMLLDWQRRFHIINGIAKGLLYLHQDSRLRIIHRDLKASNVLLDADMNPKISDFGLARSFGGNQTEAQTKKVVGTYGYMSPEYAADGLFSIKSDVFSFGVLVLEIVSGKRNRGFFLKDDNLNLIGHAWRLYTEDSSSKLVDPSLGDSFHTSEMLRSIHVGLLCVQNSPEDRPSMSTVVFMLGNEVELPQAKQPGFFREKDVFTGQSSRSANAANSGNQVTITMLEGR